MNEMDEKKTYRQLLQTRCPKEIKLFSPPWRKGLSY
jgi:hypothetical protein